MTALPASIDKSTLPTCPRHLNADAAEEWERVVGILHDMGVLTAIDRAALAAYCQAYGRWVEAEEKLKETPVLFKTPSGYVQQSPWLGIANKQLELMGRYMVELGMTPASRSRVMGDKAITHYAVSPEPIQIITRIVDPPARRTADAELAAETWVAQHGGE